ncbi:hypothetical protein ACVWYN_002480 [Pedobacter sp. UYP24]
MKKIFLTLLLAIGLISFKSSAQINLNVNIGSQPLWGPVGYDHVDYYYLPDVESYYNVPKKQFVYLNNGNWIFSPTLPTRYRGYDLYNGYKVVMNTPTPYRYFNKHKVEYITYKGKHGQPIIRNSNDAKYYVVKGNSKHVKKIKFKANGEANRDHQDKDHNDNDHGDRRENGNGHDKGKEHGKGKGKD